ncbi:carboxypeptidase B-like [Antedon mediterranea]|uniref:carboxypeptidase B-like n=1 Tax=Antedon mediterranea TaxID=105859 RepID=UPI003AF7BDB3
MIRCLCLAFLVAAVAAEKVRYDGYQVIRITPRDEADVEWIHLLEERYEGKFDFWQMTRVLERPIDIMVSPKYHDLLQTLLNARGLDYVVHIPDVQGIIDNQFSAKGILDGNNGFDYSKYHAYEEIKEWVADIAAAHSNIAESFQIATSSEGREINGLKIGKKTSGKPAVYFQGGIHAREWMSPATIMYFTNQMLETYGSDTGVTDMLDKFDWYIVPSLNVDGYVYTWTNDRMWRKTRRHESGNICTGIDPNRNYEYKWGGAGTSTNPCSDVYRGSEPHSEPELADSTSFLIKKNKTQDFHVFIDFHAYSQLWLAPWSYSKTATLPSHTKDHDAMAKACTDALKAVHGTDYDYGPSARKLYAASGCSADWGYETLRAKYSYVIELGDTGTYGFLMPESEIIPSGEENFAAIKKLGEKIVKEFAS